MRNDRIGVQLVHLVTKEIDKGPIINYEKFLSHIIVKFLKIFIVFIMINLRFFIRNLSQI